MRKLLLLALGFLVSPARAQIIFNNVIDPVIFYPRGGWAIAGGSPQDTAAFQFRSEATAVVDFIDLPIWGTGKVTVSLANVVPGPTPGLPGSLLESVSGLLAPKAAAMSYMRYDF